MGSEKFSSEEKISEDEGSVVSDDADVRGRFKAALAEASVDIPKKECKLF